jgi:hypothetical protein
MLMWFHARMKISVVETYSVLWNFLFSMHSSALNSHKQLETRKIILEKKEKNYEDLIRNIKYSRANSCVNHEAFYLGSVSIFLLFNSLFWECRKIFKICGINDVKRRENIIIIIRKRKKICGIVFGRKISSLFSSTKHKTQNTLLRVSRTIVKNLFCHQPKYTSTLRRGMVIAKCIVSISDDFFCFSSFLTFSVEFNDFSKKRRKKKNASNDSVDCRHYTSLASWLFDALSVAKNAKRTQK